MSHTFVLIVLYVLVFVLNAPLQAQSRGGMLQGKITETRYIKKKINLPDTSTGLLLEKLATIRKTLPVKGVEVRLAGTMHRTRTDSSGYYYMENLPRGLFDITYSAKGFKSDEFHNVFIKNDTISEIDILMYRILSTAEESLVWVNRYQAPLRFIANSISSVSIDDLHRKGMHTYEAIEKRMTSLQFLKQKPILRSWDGYTGYSASNVMLMIDNQAFQTPVRNKVPVSFLDYNSVQQVDVVYGSQSALLGSGASDGAIHVTSKHGFETKTQISAYGGLYSSPPNRQWESQDGLAYSKGMKFSRAQNLEKANLYGSFEYIEDDGYLKVNAKDDWKLYAFADYQFSAGNKLSVWGMIDQTEEALFSGWKSYAEATEQPIEQTQHSTERLWNMASKLNVKLSKVTAMEFGAGYMKTTTTDFYDRSFEGDRQSFQTQLLFDFGYGYHLLGGIETYRHGLSSDDFGNHEDMVAGFYIQNENPLVSNVRVTYGARFDMYSLDHAKLYAEFNPQFGIVAPVGTLSTFHWSYNSGFRLPSLWERYADITDQGFQIVPNADLDNEYTSSFQVGYNFNYIRPIQLAGVVELSNLNLDLSLYYTALSNRVELKSVGQNQFSYRNGPDGKLWGTEISMRFSMRDEALRFFMAYHFSNPEKQLTYRRKHQATVSATYTNHPYWMAITYRYLSAYNRTSNDVTLLYVQNQSLDADITLATQLLDVSIGANLSKNISAAIHASNLFNNRWLQEPAVLGEFRKVVLEVDVAF